MICDVTTECYVIRAHVILCNDIMEIASVVYHENAGLFTIINFAVECEIDNPALNRCVHERLIVRPEQDKYLWPGPSWFN